MSDNYISKQILNAENIGKVVTIQVFRRTAIHDQLNLDTMEKYIGTLEAVGFDKISLNIKLQGLPTITTYRRKHYVEIFVNEITTSRCKQYVEFFVKE